MRTLRPTRFAIGLILGAACLMGWSGSASAVTGADFQPGRIIDDQVFYKPSDMTADQIQAFLNVRVPTCDTNGDQPYYGTYGGVTYHGNILRRNLDSRYPAPYTCLKNYYENTTTKANNLGHPSTLPAGAISAAQIIYNEAQNYGINPKVLITMLQKESAGPLPTDDWPWPTQYKTAMGYGCPDSAVCDSQYFGFYNQIHNAARQFRLYTNNPNNYNYTIGQNNIKYHPDPSACGTQLVNVLNQATANLYNYTPYVPNQAALNNLYGTGDGCSAYGNRNFWRIYNDWFGSTFGGDQVSFNMKLVGPITISPTVPVPGQAVTATYTVRNVGASAITFQASVLQCRYAQTGICGDPNWGGATAINPGEQQTFTSNIGAVQAGPYTLTPYFEQGNVWYRYSSDTGGGNSLSLTVSPYTADMRLVSPITASPATPVAGDNVMVSYAVKNFGDKPAIYQNSVLQCRYAGTVCDAGWNASVTINPGDQRTFNVPLDSVRTGSYALAPYYMQNNTWYQYNGAAVAGGNSMTLNVNPFVADMRLVSAVTASPAQPVPGQAVTVTYTVQNFSNKPAVYQNSVLQCRFNTSTVCDTDWNNTITINPGAQRAFSSTFTAVKAGTFVFVPYYMQNSIWYPYNGASVGGSGLTLTIPAYVADMHLTGAVTVSPTAPVPGQTMTVSYTVVNSGSKPALYQNAILQCRFNSAINCDPAANGTITINAGAQHTFSETFQAKAGTFMFIPYYMQNDTWYRYTPAAQGSDALQVSVPAYIATMWLMGPITSSVAQPIAGQTTTVSYTVKNIGDKPAIYQGFLLQCRFNTGTNCDSPMSGGITINPGEQRTLAASFGPLRSGAYRFVPYYRQNDTWYLYGSDTPGGNALSITVR